MEKNYMNDSMDSDHYVFSLTTKLHERINIVCEDLPHLNHQLCYYRNVFNAK